MKTRSLILLILPFLIFFSSCEEQTGLTDEEIVAGLKEALQVGTDNSTTSAHAQDGYYGNARIKIPFPENVQYVADALSNFTLLGQPVGQNSVNALVLKLNRAAEDAADEAQPIFLNAISAMTITDGLNILMGADDAATQYLRTNTYSDLKTTFMPDIETSLQNVGAQSAWADVTYYYNLAAQDTVNTDLADYTTGKALDGLFTLIADEELLIRQDPQARVTDLLKKVFAEQDN